LGEVPRAGLYGRLTVPDSHVEPVPSVLRHAGRRAAHERDSNERSESANDQGR